MISILLPTVLAYTHFRHLPQAKNKALIFNKRKRIKENDKDFLAGMSVCHVSRRNFNNPFCIHFRISSILIEYCISVLVHSSDV